MRFYQQNKRAIYDELEFRSSRRTYQNAQYTNSLQVLLTLIAGNRTVFFANGLVIFTGDESVLFVL